MDHFSKDESNHSSAKNCNPKSPLDLSDNEGSPETLISRIQSHLRKRLSQFSDVSSHAGFILAAQTFPDEVMSLLKDLSACGFENHKYLWLLTIGEILRSALAVASYADGLSDQNKQISFATASMMPTMNETCLYVETLVKKWEFVSLPTTLESTSDRLMKYFYNLLNLACDWLTKGPRLLHDETCLNVIVQRINTMHQMQCDKFLSEAFPTLAYFSRAAFLCGRPELVLKIDKLIGSVSHATQLLLHAKLELDTLIDFCRYFGYCLVTCAVSGDMIDQELCDRADGFLTALIGLPNLRLSGYIRPDADDPEAGSSRESGKYISVKQREEISFFYVINSVLRMNLLVQVVSTTERFQSECNFLLNSVHFRVSQELDVLASAPHSHSTSAVGLQAYEMEARNTLPARNSCVMSSILEDGTYKEKLLLLLSFLQHLSMMKSKGKPTLPPGQLVKLVQTFTMNGLLPTVDLKTRLTNNDIVMLVNKINKFVFPGKMLFLEALRKIVCLCELLFMKHAFMTMNIKSSFDSLLEHIFETLIPINDVINVKPLMRFSGEGELKLLNKAMPLEDEQLKEHAECLKRVTILEGQL